MTALARKRGLSPAIWLALPLGLLALEAGLLAWRLTETGPTGAISTPETVELAAATAPYRLAGEYLRAGKPADAPMAEASLPEGFTVMRYQVSQADYGLCVAEGACAAPDKRAARGAGLPVTGVSYDDATAYAHWLTRRTGTVWRLPTDAEWAVFAGEKFDDDALGLDETGNPSARWLANYEREAALAAAGAQQPEPAGAFGTNSNGLYDLAGPVWEWTSTCYGRVHLDPDGAVVSRTENCGVRVLEGRHRTAMSHFIRDARGGGCAAGVPPDNLGFRLVRETDWLSPIRALIARIAG